MNRELLPSCSSGLHDPTDDRDVPTTYAQREAGAMRMPVRSRKNAGEPPQNSECAYGEGRNDARVGGSRKRCARRREASVQLAIRDPGVRAPSSSTPTTAPANTNPSPRKEAEARTVRRAGGVCLEPVRQRIEKPGGAHDRRQQ